jgi:hypothetical protein
MPNDYEEKIDFEAMDDEQLLDKFSDDPKGFVSLIADQVRKGIERENEQKAEEDRFISTYKDFAASNPDFEEKWESGELKEFMDARPGHNALSAYLAISHESRIKRAVAEKLAQKGLGDDPLSDTKKHGGSTQVLANRLRALRSQGGGGTPPAGETESGDLKPTL